MPKSHPTQRFPEPFRIQKSTEVGRIFVSLNHNPLNYTKKPEP